MRFRGIVSLILSLRMSVRFGICLVALVSWALWVKSLCGLPTKYQLLDYGHIAFTLRRFFSMCERQKWEFDVVVGAGARHRPVAQAVAQIMGYLG